VTAATWGRVVALALICQLEDGRKLTLDAAIYLLEIARTDAEIRGRLKAVAQRA
jgi:hypothetical protein